MPMPVCVVAEPFEQACLDRLLAQMLSDAPARRYWQARALAFAEHADIYSNAERAADLILKEQP
jgi:UDP-glucose:(heptosyl)LPS alpha-1,3-glucosyltransferase